MAVMAVEAVPEAAAAGGEGAAGATAGGGARPGGGKPAGAPRNPLASRKPSAKRPARASRSRSRGGQGRLAPRENAGRQGGQGQLAPNQGSGDKRDSQDRQGALERQARKHGPKLTRTAYQRIVIAEFIATLIIIAAAPILVPRDSKSDTPDAEAAKAVKSLSLSRPLLRMSAACILFFALALMANGERAGRVAAAGGGLVTLGAFLNATDTWTAIGQMFAGASKAGAQDVAADQAADATAGGAT
jgi:hypothetical protein